MLPNDVQHWLDSGGSYAAGLDLLARTGATSTHRSLSQFLDFHFVPSHARETLTTALRQYLAANPAPRTLSVAEANPTTRQPDNLPPSEPPAISKLRTEARNLLKERDGHRAQLLQMVDYPDKFTDHDRYLQAATIMEIQEEIDSVYQRIKAWQATGSLPDLDERRQVVRDTVQKVNRVNSLRSAISRLSKRIEKMKEGPDCRTLKNELLAKQVERQELENELGIGE